MAKKSALGKGLDALMGGPASDLSHIPVAPNSVDSNPSAPIESIHEIRVDLIDANPNNPRQEFDPEMISELAASIETYGLISPVTVRAVGDRYQLIAGERRLRAARQAGLETIPVYVVTTDDVKAREMALVENIQRTDLNALEISFAFQRLIDECNLSQEELAPRVGKKRSTISNYLRLQRLPPSVQFEIRQGRISMGHARTLLSLPDPVQQEYVGRQIVDKGLSVRAVEVLIKKLLDQQEEAEQEKPVNAYVDSMQKDLRRILGGNISIKPGNKGDGKIVIAYATEEERVALMERFSLLEQ